MFFEQARAGGDRPFLWRKANGAFAPTSWSEAAARTVRLAHGLRALGIEPGDRVALVAENRPEWLIADMAIMAAGAVTVPSYTTYMPADHRHLFADSGAKAVIVSTEALRERVLAAAAHCPDLKTIIAMEGESGEGPGGRRVLAWEEALAAGGVAAEPPASAATIARTDPCCIIYTSGTGGSPKGVVLSHGAILCNCLGAYDLLYELGLEDEVFLSFLPLCHSYEHTAGQFFPVSIGAQIYYAESIEALGRNMTEAKPTIMTAVPRLYETLHARILHGLRTAPALRRRLFHAAVDLGRRRYERPDALTLRDRIADAVLDRLVRSKVRARFGGRIKALVSGGAPLNVEIGIFFTALGLRLLQGYGQTESAPVVSCNRPRNVKIHTVGPPLRDVEVRIAEDGEILVRGELVMQGYWNNPAATAEVLREGWLHTGDIGVIDADGYLQITDRKKDIIVNSGGDNVAPQRVEGFLALQPEIAQAMVYGDRRPYLVAVVVPDPDFVAEWAKANGRRPEAAAQDQDFQNAIGAVVDRVGRDLSVIERVRRFVVAPQPFTVENNMMTPSLKIRRHVIRETYRDQLEALY
ncbi:MAG: AMP-dependent synthetase/ligase [Alphaproteobacteria bacterium]